MRFYMPLASMAPVPLSYAAGLIKEAGFDGVEVLLVPGTSHDMVRDIARANGLHLNWHEIWSLQNNPSHWFNHMAALLGRIPKRTEYIGVQLPKDMHEPVVCYPHRYKEVGKYADILWLQTCPVHDRPVWYDEFCHIVETTCAKVVFDTQHVLEMKLGVWSQADLRKYSSAELHHHLCEAWQHLLPYVREIHFNDCALAGHNVGRNVFPGEGTLDLRAFATEVRSSGWSGIVTPEVAPGSLYPIHIPLPLGVPLFPRLEELHDIVSEMFM